MSPQLIKKERVYQAIGGVREAIGTTCQAIGGVREAIGATCQAIGGVCEAIGTIDQAVGGDCPCQETDYSFSKINVVRVAVDTKKIEIGGYSDEILRGISGVGGGVGGSV
ncbi:MAG: hypothetical protein JNL70_27105 [Saprospiraceae bacterium]|nr:hypothetical protein [Saprospiraceae bacterium]